MSLWSDSFFRWHQRRISKFPAIICISEIQPRSDEIIAARNVLTKSVSREQSTDWNWKSKVPQVHIPLTVINKRLDCQPATEDSSMMIVKNSFRNVRLAKITFLRNLMNISCRAAFNFKSIFAPLNCKNVDERNLICRCFVAANIKSIEREILCLVTWV